MDETAESIRSVQFRRELRGYSLEDVDAFVARVADVVDGLRQRVAAAEQAAATRSTDDPDDSLRRTLVLAQRTADLAIKEAREEAAQLVTTAHTERDDVLSGVQQEAERRRGEAEGTLREDVARLARLRDALSADTEALEAWTTAERARVRALLTEQLATLDAGGPPPASKPVMQAPDDARDDLPEHQSQADVPSDEDREAPSSRILYDDSANDGGSRADRSEVDLEPRGGGAVAVLADEDRDEDPFLAELRLAVDDDEPLGPRDDVLAPALERVPDAFVNDDEVGRFGSRRRRRR